MDEKWRSYYRLDYQQEDTWTAWHTQEEYCKKIFPIYMQNGKNTSCVAVKITIDEEEYIFHRPFPDEFTRVRPLLIKPVILEI